MRTAKKAVGLDWQSNNFARDHAFLYISLPSLLYYDVNLPNITFCGGFKHKTTTLLFSFHKLWYSPLESNSSQIRQHLTNWTRWNKRDRAWRSANTLFNWRFRSCRRRWTLLKLSINEVRREGKRAYARGELLWYFDLGVGRWFGRRVLIRAWAL